MKLIKLISPFVLSPLILLAGIWMLSSCDNLKEDLPECRLYVQFKYDYNIKSADAFSVAVDKVELYVFDRDGKFLFKQSEDGSPLATGNYRMEVEIPVGEYRLMAWAGAHDSYNITPLIPGTSSIEELKLKLKREQTSIINKDLEPLWYGEIIDINFTGTHSQTEIINLIKDTNKIRFLFENMSSTSVLDVEAYTYEVIESNGYLDYDNSLLPDDILIYQPYYIEQSDNTGIIELNTMRLMADRKNHFVVKEKATGKTVFKIDLTDFFIKLRLEEYKKWSEQEYLDRKDEYQVVFFLSGGSTPDNPWLSVYVIVNGWTWYIQNEDLGEEL